MHVYDVLVRALMSEKSMKESEAGKYTFLVNRKANKNDVKRAVEAFFQVNVVSVLTTTQKGRTKRVGTRRTEVKEGSFKKAVVRLKKGQTLGGASEAAEKPKEKQAEEKASEKKSLLSGVLPSKKKKSVVKEESNNLWQN